MKLIQGHRPERSCQMNIFKEIEKAGLCFNENDEDDLSISELRLIERHYKGNIDLIYAGYLLGYSRGKKRGAKNAIAKRPNNVSC